MIGQSAPDGDLDVSRETLESLRAFSELVVKWTRSINLIAPNTVKHIWDRHLADSVQVLKLAPDSWKTWTDLGSGGGFPGIVVAILDPLDRPITLIESDQRKSLFLNTVRRELGLNVIIENKRIEDLDIALSDVLSARALAPLPSLLQYTQALLKPDGTALFPKGSRYQEELDQASIRWHFDVKAHTSITQSDARVLCLTRIKPREC